MPEGVNYSKWEVADCANLFPKLFSDLECSLRKGDIFPKIYFQFFNINSVIAATKLTDDAAFNTFSDAMQFYCKRVFNFNSHNLVFSADVSPLGFVIVIPFLEVTGTDQIVGSTYGVFLVCLGDACVPLRESEELFD